MDDVPQGGAAGGETAPGGAGSQRTGSQRTGSPGADGDSTVGSGALGSDVDKAIGATGITGTSRRSPSVETEGTLLPEGGGRAASGAAPVPARQWPILLVLTGVALGLLVMLGSFRAGLLLIGGFLILGGVLRVAATNVGMLAVRSRFTDVITYGVLGLGVVLLALMAMPEPVLEIPWLTDVIRFAVR